MLQLREKVEELLNNSGLGFLHIERNSDAQLVLAGECGQPLVIIKGVTVPTTINNKEREYLWTLINRFISNKLDDIKIIIEHKRNPIIPEDVSDKYNFDHVDVDGEGNLPRLLYDLPGKGNRVYVTLGKKEIYVSTVGYTILSFKNMQRVLVNMSEYKKILTKYEALYQKQKATDKIVNALQTCTI